MAGLISGMLEDDYWRKGSYRQLPPRGYEAQSVRTSETGAV
jgi:hypothetical protein